MVFDPSFIGSFGFAYSEVAISLALGTLIAGLISGAASLWNTHSQEKTNEENLDHADSLTTAQWERDDSSFQRQVADAKAAGLSPLSVTGYAPSSSPVTAMAQAPQMDLSQMIGALGSAGDIALGEKQLGESKRQFDQTMVLETYKATEAVNQLQQQIDQTALEHKDQVKQFAASLEYQYNLLNDQIDTHVADQNAVFSLEFQKEMARASEDSWKTYETLCNTLEIAPPVQYYTDYSAYINALNDYSLDWSKMMFKSDTSAKSYTTAENTSSSVNVNANAAGTGLGVGASDSNGVSYASSYSDDYTRFNSSLVLPMDGEKYKKFPVFKYKASEKTYSSESKSDLKSSYMFD